MIAVLPALIVFAVIGLLCLAAARNAPFGPPGVWARTLLLVAGSICLGVAVILYAAIPYHLLTTT